MTSKTLVVKTKDKIKISPSNFTHQKHNKSVDMFDNMFDMFDNMFDNMRPEDKRMKILHPPLKNEKK